MYARYILLADSAHNDQDGKLHISGIFENIISQKYPCNHGSLTIIAGLECTADELKSINPVFKYRDSQGNDIKSFKIPRVNIKDINSKATVFRFNVFLKIDNLLINAAGHYEIALFISNRYIDSVTFNAMEVVKTDRGAKA